MARVIGLSGSLRRGSFNTALLRAAAKLVPEGDQLEVHTIHGIPLYDGDVEEKEGIPEAVSKLKDWIAGADGLLISTPEYNNSIPGVLKNAIDWMTRPYGDIARVWKNKPVAVMGATIGNFGTILSQNAWWGVLRHINVELWLEGRVMISKADGLFDSSGELTDEKTRQQLREFVGGFFAHIKKSKS